MKKIMIVSLVVITSFCLLNALSASSKDFFLTSDDFDFIARNARSYQAEKEQPFEGKIYFGLPNGVMEFKYILDTKDKGNKFDTPVTQFSSDKSFWNEISDYYDTEVDFLIKNIHTKSVQEFIDKKNIDDRKPKNIYFPLEKKVNKSNEVENKRQKTSHLNEIIFSKTKPQSIENTVKDFVKKTESEDLFHDIKINEKGGVTITSQYPHFDLIDKSYRIDNVGMFKIFLSHENITVPKNVQKFESFEKAFQRISQWAPNDLKLKARKYEEESAIASYYL